MSSSLEDCLKLLKGERDEQRLAGLLLVTKFCKGDDHSSLHAIYDAVGPLFLHRLLKTGMGGGNISSDGDKNRDVYLQLSVTVLAAFCRVPDIASSEDMVLKIPLILEVMSMKLGSSVLEECYEFLYLVSNASEDGIMTFFESEGIKILASQITSLQDGSHLMEISIKLVHLILSRIPLDRIRNGYLSELAVIVAAIARQFAVLHNNLKFEALHLLGAILSSKDSVPLYDSLRLLPNDSWSQNIRIGVTAMLQNRVAPAERLQALMLAESMVSIYGENWLIGIMTANDSKNPAPAGLCLLLVLEQSRVEIAVLLNELAYLKYEAPKDTSATSEAILSKRRNVAVAYSLVEKIIKLISNIGENDGNPIDEGTFMKVICQLNETIGVVLEYLEDAKEHGQNKGDDLLASVRIVGSYLAEAPLACKEKVRELLGYMLHVEGEDEQSPFYSVCFLLPMLCQLTLKIEGCKALVSCGGHGTVLDCLSKLIGSNNMVEDNGCLFLACDTIMNILLKKDTVQLPLEGSAFLDILKALAYWSENTDDTSSTMMASSLCALIFDYTSEEALLSHPDFDHCTLNSLYRLIARSLASSGQDTKADDTDLLEIITAGYRRWVDRYPNITKVVNMGL